MTEKQLISKAMKALRARVADHKCARTPEQLQNAINARWPNRASGKVRNGKVAKKS